MFYFDWLRLPMCFDLREPNFVWAKVWGEKTGVEMVLFRKAAFDGLRPPGVPTVGEETVGMRGFSVGGVQLERFVLAPRPDDDEPLEEFRFVVFGDVGERLIRLLIESDRREIVSALSGMGRKICASGLNGRIGSSTSAANEIENIYQCDQREMNYHAGMVLHVLHYHLRIHCWDYLYWYSFEVIVVHLHREFWLETTFRMSFLDQRSSPTWSLFSNAVWNFAWINPDGQIIR